MTNIEMDPLLYSCPSCLVHSGRPCVWIAPYGTGFHRERWEEAASMVRNPDPMSKEAFEDDVEKSGLV